MLGKVTKPAVTKPADKKFASTEWYKVCKRDLNAYINDLDSRKDRWKINCLWTLCVLMNGDELEKDLAKRFYDQGTTTLFNNLFYSNDTVELEEMRNLVKEAVYNNQPDP